MFNKIKNAHQFYRDYFTREIESDSEIVNYILTKNENILTEIKKYDINDNEYNLLITIYLSNFFLDYNRQGIQDAPPKIIKDHILQNLKTLHKNQKKDIILIIKILFRIGEIEKAFNLIEENIVDLYNEPIILKILLISYLFEENYDEAFKITKNLLQYNLIQDDWFTLILIVTSIYKYGITPEDFIDFSSLNKKYEFPDINYVDHIEYNPNNKKTTCLICCDATYYWEYTIPLVYSIIETNKDLFNIHIHVYNISNDEITKTKEIIKKQKDINISLTSEKMDPQNNIKVKYASSRYIFTKKLLNDKENPVLILDADHLFNQTITENIIKQAEKSSIILTKNEYAPFWEKHLGGFVFLKNDKKSKKFIENVSHFILRNYYKNNYHWFLDQIALSACADKLTENEVSYIDSALVCDVNYSSNSIIWTATTFKKNEVYLSKKEQLLKKYDVDSFLGNFENKNILHFIEIGTSNFDTLTQSLNEDHKGLSIDPIKKYLNDLPNKKNHTKIQAAISDIDSETKVFYIDPKKIDILKLPQWLKGCNSIEEIHPTIVQTSKEKNIPLNELVTIETVKTLRLSSLVNKLCIENIFILKIDTEGHDYKILMDFFENAPKSLYPHILNFESNHLMNDIDFNTLLLNLLSKGYDLISSNRSGGDCVTIMRLNLKKIENKKTNSSLIPYLNKKINGKTICPEEGKYNNNLEDARSFSLENGYSGVTYKHGIFYVSDGHYLIEEENTKIKSLTWLNT